MREEIKMAANVSPSPVNKPAPASMNDAWGTSYLLGVCEQCDWLFLVPQASGAGQPAAAPVCPHCFQARLSAVEQDSALASQLRPPELYLPFALSPAALQQILQSFSSGIRFAPADLSLTNLQARLQCIYLPVWLVDSQIQATWEAEVGMNYQVVSHQDRFDDRRGGWSSREVEETRVRWEARAGRLNRSYQNIGAPALQAHPLIVQRLGNYDLTKSQPYAADKAWGGIPAGRSYARLPDRSQVDAWPDVLPRFQQVAENECQQACSGDHFREFRWTPEFRSQNWTLMLMPAYTTYYVDDDGRPHTLFIHGQSGRLSGQRRASMKRAQKSAIWLAAVGLIVSVISLLLVAATVVLPPILILGGIGLVVGLAFLLSACIPLIMVWSTNRNLPDSGPF